MVSYIVSYGSFVLYCVSGTMFETLSESYDTLSSSSTLSSIDNSITNLEYLSIENYKIDIPIEKEITDYKNSVIWYGKNLLNTLFKVFRKNPNRHFIRIRDNI